jgi:diguanylate cyclase (GGDEF)-like protein
MSNDDPWLDKRKTKDSAFNRRVDSVRSTQFKLPAQKQQRDWNSGVFSAHTMSDDQAPPASAYRPDHPLASNYQSGQFAAREAEPKAPQPISSSYDPGHFAKPDNRYDIQTVEPQPVVSSEISVGAPFPSYNNSTESTSSQQALITTQPPTPTPAVTDFATMSNQEIDALAFFDPQTQAYNFRYIVRRIEHELSRAKYYERTISILVISIDTIKIIPAELGQDPVDKCLGAVAQALFRNVRPIDLVGRYTDDRFVVVCPEVSVEQVSELAEEIRKACANSVVKHQWQEFRLSVSIGIAVSSPEFDDVESLIAIADVGADMITQRGGDGVCFGADLL